MALVIPNEGNLNGLEVLLMSILVLVIFRFEISELKPCHGLGHPKQSCNKTNCVQNHCQLGYSESTKNITGFADIAQFLLHPVILNLVIDFLKTQQNSLGANAAVYWVDFRCKFTLSDCLLIKSVINEVISVKRNVTSAIEQFEQTTRSPPGVKNPDNDPSLQAFQTNLIHNQIQIRSHCSYGNDPNNFHIDEDNHRRSIT